MEIKVVKPHLFFILSFAILFWTIFDSSLQYVTPLLIEGQGFSNSMIGLIIGSSSVAGAIFDFFICKLFKNTNFRRTFLVMFAICFVYPFLLWQAKSIWMFLFAMAVWGVYYDLYGFGLFDFIGKYTKRSEHSSSFGIVQVFKALGSIVAPLIVGLVIVENVDWRSFALSWIFLSIGFMFLLVLLVIMRKKPAIDEAIVCRPRHKGLLLEVRLWKKLGKVLSPVLLLTFYLFFIDAFFWTLAPLYAENTGLQQFGGLFLMAYSLPGLIVGWFISPVANRFGKKRIAYSSLLVGSLILSLFFFINDPILAIGSVFIASFFISMALPIINSSYADYICDAPQVESEIEGIEDFSVNIGYIIGPIMAGVLADLFSIKAAFGILGIIGAVLALLLLIFAPKHIIIKTKASEL